MAHARGEKSRGDRGLQLPGVSLRFVRKCPAGCLHGLCRLNGWQVLSGFVAPRDSREWARRLVF